MNDLLLQVQHETHNVNEFVFTMKDTIMLVGGIVSLLGSYFALKYGQKAADEKISLLKEDILTAKHGRNAIKKECMEKAKEVDEMARARIDKTQAELKEYSTKTDQEFKEINQSMNKVEQLSAEIKGMVNTLLNKQ